MIEEKDVPDVEHHFQIIVYDSMNFSQPFRIFTFDFDSINAPLQQDDSVKNGLRRIHKIGLFKMEGRNEIW